MCWPVLIDIKCFSICHCSSVARRGGGYNHPPIRQGASPAGRGCSHDFRFCPSGLFLAPPQRYFLGRKKLLVLVEKTFEFVISARKSLRIAVKTFFFWDHLILSGKSLRISAKTFFFGDHLIFTETSPQSNSGIMKKLFPLILILPPSISRSWRRPCIRLSTKMQNKKNTHF